MCEMCTVDKLNKQHSKHTRGLREQLAKANARVTELESDAHWCAVNLSNLIRRITASTGFSYGPVDLGVILGQAERIYKALQKDQPEDVT